MRFPHPEQRSPRDILIATVAILALLAAFGLNWVTSEQRTVDHTTAEKPLTAPKEPDKVPVNLQEQWRSETQLTRAPLVTGGGVLTVEQDANTASTLIMRDAITGDEVWRYRRELPLCDVTTSSGRIVAVYHGPKGCGDVLSFDGATGQYAHGRSSLAEEDSLALRSNDSTGRISSTQVELWRSDLIRTVFVGNDPTPVRADAQAYPDCRFTSALTRTDLLAVEQTCPDQEKKLVRLLKREPERPDTPEVFHEFYVPQGSELVTIGQDRAGVYAPRGAQDDGPPQLIVMDTHGGVKHFDTPEAPVLDDRDASAEKVFEPNTADQPHHMTWWTGKSVVGFSPSTQEPAFEIPDALGTGVVMKDQMLVPVPGGIAVFSLASLRDPLPTPERIIAVDRGDAAGTTPVNLRVSGDVVLEQRGETVVALR